MPLEVFRELISKSLSDGGVAIADLYQAEQSSDGSPLEKAQGLFLRTLLGLPVPPFSRKAEKYHVREMERSLILACLGDPSFLFKLMQGELSTGLRYFKVGENDFDPQDYQEILSVMEALYDQREVRLSPYFETLKNYLLPRVTFQEGNVLTGIGAFKNSLFQVGLTCQGMSSGFGGIYKENGKILQFGPCFFPLGMGDHFGIFRGEDECQDVRIEADPFRFSGWARASYHEKPTNLWTFIDFVLKEGTGTLKVKFNPCSDFTPSAFVFFIEGESATVSGKKTLRPGTLDRYQEGAMPVIFGDNHLSIKPLFQSEMQLIPLSGGTHYWGANFLLAFAITDEMKTYSFEIK